MQNQSDLFGVPKRSSPTSTALMVTTCSGGSTNTLTRTWSTLVSASRDVTWIQDTVFGDRFVVNTPGVYWVSFSDTITGGNYIGVTINGDPTVSVDTNLTNNPASVIALGMADGTYANDYAFGVWPCKAGDVIRTQTGVSNEGANVPLHRFIMVKIS